MNQNSKQPAPDPRKVMQEKNDAAAKLFEEILNTELFPVERLSENWKRHAILALMKSAPIHHRLGLKQFADVVGCSEDAHLTLFQFGVLSNSLETVSPDTLQADYIRYGELVKEALEHIHWYQNRMKEIRDHVQLEVDKQFAVATNNGGVFKAIKGEA